MLKRTLKNILITMIVALLIYLNPHVNCVVYSNDNPTPSIEDISCIGDYSFGDSILSIKTV